MTAGILFGLGFALLLPRAHADAPTCQMMADRCTQEYAHIMEAARDIGPDGLEEAIQFGYCKGDQARRHWKLCMAYRDGFDGHAVKPERQFQLCAGERTEFGRNCKEHFPALRQSISAIYASFPERVPPKNAPRNPNREPSEDDCRSETYRCKLDWEAMLAKDPAGVGTDDAQYDVCVNRFQRKHGRVFGAICDDFTLGLRNGLRYHFFRYNNLKSETPSAAMCGALVSICAENYRSLFANVRAVGSGNYAKVCPTVKEDSPIFQPCKGLRDLYDQGIGEGTSAADFFQLNTNNCRRTEIHCAPNLLGKIEGLKAELKRIETQEQNRPVCPKTKPASCPRGFILEIRRDSKGCETSHCVRVRNCPTHPIPRCAPGYEAVEQRRGHAGSCPAPLVCKKKPERMCTQGWRACEKDELTVWEKTKDGCYQQHCQKRNDPLPENPGVECATEKVAKVTEELGLDPFYKKYTCARGLIVASSDKVPDQALLESQRLMKEMTGALDEKNPALLKWLRAKRIRTAVIGEKEFTTTLPELSDLQKVFPDKDWDGTTRGAGATLARPVTAAAEENLLCAGRPKDRWDGESILVHEFAHTIYLAVRNTNSDLHGAVQAAYNKARANGLWENTYAATNDDEYFAEIAQSWFDANQTPAAGQGGANEKGDGLHNGIRTRKLLRNYDTEGAAVMERIFGDENWRYSCPK